MSAVPLFAAGNYRYIKAVFQYSGGVAAEPGFEIERAQFFRPLPLADAFAAIEAHLKRMSRPTTAFAACELRLCAADTTFRFPGVRFGLALGTRRLSERVGANQARRWLLDGIEVKADEALRAALANGFRLVANSADAASINVEITAAVGNEVVDRETGAAIRALTRRDDADHDLAELVRSASRPGLKARIESYVASLRKL